MAQILDSRGNPIDRGTLTTSQTAEVATLRNAFLMPWINGLTPAMLADYLYRADQGFLTAQHRVFADMEERDPHLAAEMGKRKQAIVNLDWQLVPPPDATAAEKATAQWADGILRSGIESFEDLLVACQDAIGHGFAPIELEWQMQGGELLPVYYPRPQEWFRLSVDRRALHIMDGSAEGAPLKPFGWIVHQPGKAKTGYLGRLGLHRVVSWPFLYKAYAISDFAEFLETFGLPIIVGKYGQGASAEQKNSLYDAVSALGHDARAIMPVDMQLEISKIAAGGGGGTPHLDMIHWADDAQSKAILGQTLSAEAKSTGMGSGVAKLHDQVRLDIQRADARQVADTLTRDLIYPLIALNRGIADMRRCPRLVFDTNDLQDIAVYANALPALSGLMDIPADWVRERLGIPAPVEGEDVLKAPAAPPAQGKTQVLAGLSVAQASSLLPASTVSDPPDAQSRLADNLVRSAAPAMGKILDDVRQLVDEAHSLQALQAVLTQAYGHMDSVDLTRIMELAFAVADLAGLADHG
jgi:phage gp29-like protein